MLLLLLLLQTSLTPWGRGSMCVSCTCGRVGGWTGVVGISPAAAVPTCPYANSSIHSPTSPSQTDLGLTVYNHHHSSAHAHMYIYMHVHMPPPNDTFPLQPRTEWPACTSLAQ
ncbi:uncharacterized protein K452DRAFT_306684 [Aplosporella prunicola CBS 121167]|uniref:Secreted protein n=1 Tax=Aplosporella prunicola CBS 121167 TaxID=1176127 RepID=A0A6A6BIT6_9PEZI|nr:uncharacterized protein K452DRAFT_306684 [Aplosporella prunicola CBS 121167]KAF2144050.1 hypothetical protein K452DRAFT_306684 [Aplosporella prunicola CBS 121167]